MGGVLIKLGQFLSIRVDILPPEVTRELAGLQDEIPAEPYDAILAQIEEDFGRPVADIFEWFEPEPLGAASLAQAHLAQGHDGQAARVIRRAVRLRPELLRTRRYERQFHHPLQGVQGC